MKYQTPDCGEINGKQLDYATQDIEDLVDLLRLGKKKFEFKTRSLVYALAHSIEGICKTIWREYDKDDVYDFIPDDPKRPLGPTLAKLSENNIVDKNTLKSLFLFNNIVWNPYKHNIGLTYPNGRNHLFSVPEVVLITFIVVTLTRKLIPLIHFDYEWRCNDWKWKNTSLLIDEMDKNRNNQSKQ